MGGETRTNVIEYHESLIEDYLSKKGSVCCKGSIEQYTAEQENIENAIKVAIKSEFKYGRKKHPHQYHIYDYVYENFKKNLLNVKEKIKVINNFDELLIIIENNSPSGAGELFCYDVALRIGHYLKKLPDKIYVHSGTRKGLEKLFNEKIKEKSLYQYELPEPFNLCDLADEQLEDFFCIYKENICGIKENISSIKCKPLPKIC